MKDEDVGSVSKLIHFNLKDTLPLENLTFDLIKSNFDSLKQNTFAISKFSQTKIEGTIDLKAQKMVYFSIPFDIGWNIIENGNPLKKVILSNGKTGLFLNSGNHTLELIYTSTK